MPGEMNYGFRNIYPDMEVSAATVEQTQPDEAEQANYRTATDGEFTTPKKTWSYFGVIVALFLLLYALGKVG